MYRLKLSNRLIHDCHRFVYSITPDFHSHNFNIVNAVAHKNIEKPSSKPLEEAIRANKFAYSGPTKIGAFGAVGRYGHQCQSRSFLTVPNFNRCGAVRSFSDDAAPTLPIVGQVRLEGLLKSLSECPPVEFCQDGLVWLHQATGLPWWATIVVACWTFRSALILPLAIYQQHIVARVTNTHVEMGPTAKRLAEEVQYKVHKRQITERYANIAYRREYIKEWKKLVERDNCHPFKSHILTWCQISMWVILTGALRNLCYMLPLPDGRAQMTFLELTTGGFGWMTNLAAPDPCYVIPVAVGLLNLAITEVHALMVQEERTKRQKFLLYFFRTVSLAIIPLAAMVPSAISLFWASSAAHGLAQNLLMLSPSLRRRTRIPLTHMECQQPYRLMYENVRQRIGLGEISPPPSVVKKSKRL